MATNVLENDDSLRTGDREQESEVQNQEEETEVFEDCEGGPTGIEDCERESTEISETVQRNSERRYPLRNKKAKEFPDYVLYQASELEQDPLTVKETLSRPDSKQWRDAIQESNIDTDRYIDIEIYSFNIKYLKPIYRYGTIQ
ncbi:hypothetical protein ACJJTC_001975 [Scirpophaga incertulas]